MKQIVFKHLKIKNFLSIGDEGLDIDFDAGVHIITGKNLDKEDSKNGVGKSAVSDALFFALFGTPLRNILVDNIPNWKTGKTCAVSLEFVVIENYIAKNYQIIRSLNPSKVELIEDGENISRTVSKTNTMLKRILGSTPEMIEQSTIMSLNQTEPFLRKTPTVKRKFIEGIFKLDIFSEMLAIIRHDLGETKRIFTLEKTRVEEIQKNITVYKKQQKDSIDKKELRIIELENRRKNNAIEIQNLDKTLYTIDDNEKVNIDNQIENLKKTEVLFDDKIKGIIQNNTTYQSSILSFKEKLEEIDEIGDELCLTCKRSFNDNDKEQHKILKNRYQSEVNNLNNQIILLTKDAQETEKLKQQCKVDIESLFRSKHELELQQKEIDNITQRIMQCGAWNKQIQIDIDALSNEKDTYIELIDETIKRLTILTNKQQELQSKLEILDVSKFIVSEEGVRSFIIKKMLQMLNNRLNFYLKKLDANCICTFNEYFEENIFTEQGRSCSYFNFSGGEQKRIDLAILFTFLDIRRLQSNVSMNIAVYDELLDTSIDGRGIECVLEILKDRVASYNEAVFIISHKNDAIKHATGEIIFLQKQNEITTRIKYDTTI
jgi:DNA repair exonuclease SbcCD ATPase subunit